MQAKPAPIAKTDLFGRLPQPWPDDPRPRIRRICETDRRKVVVLDDDPTGTQTVHGIPVLTRWPLPALQAELAAPEPAFFMLTNSRSLPQNAACTLNERIGRDLVAAAELADRRFVVVSRSDSTLRGHFPSEVNALAGALGGRFDAWVLVPFFEEGERYTVGDIHYLGQEGMLVPVGLTEYARDAVFGFRASNLRDWVAEKTGGGGSAADVASISIEDLRLAGPPGVADRLMRLHAGRICVVNAACYRDLEVFTLGLLNAESRGKRFLCRSAASFVQVRAGISARPLLSAAELDPPPGGGLVVVGSHVPRTSAQLVELLERTRIHPVEIDAGALVDAHRCGPEIERTRLAAQSALGRGEDVVIYTSRDVIGAENAESSLQIGQRIAEGLTAVVRAVSVRPCFVIAKGGITSSVTATAGLDVQRALVCGQIRPGVPVWRLGNESRFPDLIYVVFPGNVGGPSALADVFEELKRA